ncbi:hypothetical protein [Streptomyces lavenduligriseus]|uniref:WXG100 family type VII secretion target n=1 Tax=Streptomyces lavenduligriseus TaxID=67315 RepID=A0ABT0P258_9ACTN|nr:hypothetical protein [Streptomyces lavenduligriseus]MCL3997087.1 hypothetical protein [Streptomyces lavenduligriseus]
MAGADTEITGAERPVGMRLNQLPGDVGGSPTPPGLPGGQGKLVSTPAEKQAAANAIEQHIEPDTRKAGDHADTETDAAVRAFRDGWRTSGALKKAHTAWGEQVKNLMNMLASDKAALRSANITLQGTDIQVGSNTNAVSVFNGY